MTHSPHSPHSPHSLESFVPPMDLCRKIPKGRFIESALVWLHVEGEWDVYSRYEDVDGSECGEIPAPTLQEILAEFHNFHLEKFGKDNPCSIIVKRDPENFSHYFANHSPVVAALKLYLNLSYDPSVLSDLSDPSDRSTPEAQP